DPYECRLSVPYSARRHSEIIDETVISASLAKRLRAAFSSDAERAEQLGQGRIGQSHRCDLLVVHLWVHTEHHAGGSPGGGPPG
ncbi:MAG: hypothetical protein ACP5P9_09530, partial [Acidimicrobiales bacterium]